MINRVPNIKFSLISIMFLFVINVFSESNRVDGIDWKILKGFELDSTERKTLLKLADSMGLSDDIYEVWIGDASKYDTSIVAIVKEFMLENDTIHKERWLYVKKMGWPGYNLFSRWGNGDSTIEFGPFLTDEQSVYIKKKYVYRYSNKKKLIELYPTVTDPSINMPSYNWIKKVLDCILNGNVVVDTTKMDSLIKLSEINKKYIQKKAFLYYIDHFLDFDVIRTMVSGEKNNCFYRFWFKHCCEKRQYYEIKVELTSQGCRVFMGRRIYSEWRPSKYRVHKNAERQRKR